MMGWQWHQLDHMQILYTSLQTDYLASTSILIFTGWMLLLPRLTAGVKSSEGKTLLLQRYRLPTLNFCIRVDHDHIARRGLKVMGYVDGSS